jgi:hypothetical protein
VRKWPLLAISGPEFLKLPPQGSIRRRTEPIIDSFQDVRAPTQLVHPVPFQTKIVNDLVEIKWQRDAPIVDSLNQSVGSPISGQRTAFQKCLNCRMLQPPAALGDDVPAAACCIEPFMRCLAVTHDVFTNDAFQSVCGLRHDVLWRDMPCTA